MSAGRFAKGGLSHCKRPSFSVQKATFYNAKDGLLQSRLYRAVSWAAFFFAAAGIAVWRKMTNFALALIIR